MVNAKGQVTDRNLVGLRSEIHGNIFRLDWNLLEVMIGKDVGIKIYERTCSVSEAIVLDRGLSS